MQFNKTLLRSEMSQQVRGSARLAANLTVLSVPTVSLLYLETVSLYVDLANQELLCKSGSPQIVVTALLLPPECWHRIKAAQHHTQLSNAFLKLASQNTNNAHIGSFVTVSFSLVVSLFSWEKKKHFFKLF